MIDKRKAEQFKQLQQEYESRGYTDFGTWETGFDVDLMIEHLSKALLTNKTVSQLFPEYYKLSDNRGIYL